MEVLVEKKWTLILSDYDMTNLKEVLRTVQRQLRISDKDVNFVGELLDMISDEEEG
jgi:hypothetical protein